MSYPLSPHELQHKIVPEFTISFICGRQPDFHKCDNAPKSNLCFFFVLRMPYNQRPPHTLNYMLTNALVGPLECRLPVGSIHNITHLLASCSSCQNIYQFNLSATQQPIYPQFTIWQACLYYHLASL